MITYSTNRMGPISLEWFRERGLLEEGSVEPTTYYSAGRIDIRDSSKHGYDGWHEYSIAPMHGEDWNALGDWLDRFCSEELLTFEQIIETYEEDTRGRKIRWADDIWFKCYECGLVTDLRETTEHIHKLDCTRNWDK